MIRKEVRVLTRRAKRAAGAVEALTFSLVLRLRNLADRRVRAGILPGGPAFPRIVLDGVIFQWTSHGEGLGIGRVWNRLMVEWSASGFARHVVVLDRGGATPRHECFTYLRVPPVRGFDSFAQRLMLEGVCRAQGAAVFVSTYYTHPLRCPTTLYVYDMTPEVLGWDLREQVWSEKHGAIRYASSLIALSESTAADLRRLFPAESRKPMVVITPGLDPVFFPASREEIADLVDTLRLPEHYYLFTGSREGYKNARLLFEAAVEFQGRPDVSLLFVGGAEALEPAFAALAGDLVTRVAHLSDQQLRAAYSGAAALLYVSKYEGFGLPILEAMACGCPVITCENSSQREVAGPAAIYIDDADPVELAEAMRHVLREAVRTEMVYWGRVRAAEFAWAARAADVAEAVCECARRARR